MKLYLKEEGLKLNKVINEKKKKKNERSVMKRKD